MSQLTGTPVGLPSGGTSQFFTTPFPIQPGQRARDTEGNEFVFCDFTATVYYGVVVAISSAHLATPLLGTAAIGSRVGIVCGGTPSTVSNSHPTSDHGGWVQIYGVHTAVQTGAASGGLVSDSTVGGYWCVPQASIGTPSGTFSVILQGAGTSIAQSSVDGNIIFNMWLVPQTEVSDLVTMAGASGASGPVSNDVLNATSGAATSAFIGQTYAVFLNYPYILGATQPLSDATT